MKKFINTKISDQTTNTTNEKNARPQIPQMGKMPIDLIILKLLYEGYYAQEICRKESLSAKKVSQIIKWLKEKKLITQISNYPKLYELTTNGKLLLNYPVITSDQQKLVENAEKELRLKPEFVEKCRSHCLRFKNILIQRPHWLERITRQGQIYGLNIKRIYLNNWSKHIIYIPFLFKHIDNVEINHRYIIYNCKHKFADFGDNLTQQIGELKDECKEVRDFLVNKGFAIHDGEPALVQNPHFEFLTSRTKKDPIGKMGEYLNFVAKNQDGYWDGVDDSPPKSGGKVETNDIQKAQTILDMPNDMAKLKAEMNDTKKEVNEIKTTVKDLVDEIRNLISVLKPSEPNLSKLPPSQQGGMFS